MAFLCKGGAIYTIDTPRQTNRGHAGLVLPPLFMTMVFCFVLVLIQQHQAANRSASTQNKQSAPGKAHPKLSSSSLQSIDPLQPIVVAQPSSQTAAAAATAVPASGAAGAVSAPSQPSKSSGSAVQAAAPSSQPSQVIVYRVTQPLTKTLSNLLPK